MANVPFLRLLLLAALLPPAACASGDDTFIAGGGGPVTPQSNGDAGASIGTPGSGDDSGTPTTESDSAAPTTGDDSSSAPPGDDSSAPPPGDDSSAPPVADANPPPPAQVDSGSGGTCPGYASPTTPANCSCDPTLHACTANNCYNGYWCETSVNKCVKAPAGC